LGDGGHIRPVRRLIGRIARRLYRDGSSEVAVELSIRHPMGLVGVRVNLGDGRS
jgi:hypothetical protein